MIKRGICKTCKWRYETQYSVGCNNPSPDRIKVAESYHCELYHNPCPLWEAITQTTDVMEESNDVLYSRANSTEKAILGGVRCASASSSLRG